MKRLLQGVGVQLWPKLNCSITGKIYRLHFCVSLRQGICRCLLILRKCTGKLPNYPRQKRLRLRWLFVLKLRGGGRPL